MKLHFGVIMLIISLLIAWCISEKSANNAQILKQTQTSDFKSNSISVTDKLHTPTTSGQLNTLELKINELKLKFPTEDEDVFWGVVFDPIRSMFQEGDTVPPAVILISTSRSNRDIAECLIREVAMLVETLFEVDGNTKPYITIEPIRMRLMDPGEARDKLERALISNYQEGHITAVIHDLGYLPLETIDLLHSYYDPTTSQYRKVILLTTVYLDPMVIPMSGEEVKASLRDEWKEIGKEVLDPLMSIISNNIAIMTSMESDELCGK